MKKLFSVMVLIGLLGFASVANAAIALAGVERDAFVGLLNNFSTGGTWSAPDGFLNFTPNGNPVNNFANRIRFYDEHAAAITLTIGRGQGGVVVGRFYGGGSQRLDLDDIEKFHANIAADPVLDLQPAVIMHEIAEAFSSALGGVFDPAHLTAITEENSELTSRGSRGMRGGPPDGWRPGQVLGIDILVPWSDSADPTVRRMVVNVTAGNVSWIAPGGLVNTGVPYDGTEQDITIESIFLEREEEPTAITLSSFTAEAKGGRVVVRWETETEIDNVGFNILRSDSASGNYVKINKKLIPAKMNAVSGASYESVDRTAKPGRTYFYKLEDVDRNGTSTLHGPVFVKVNFKKKVNR